jgi:hypothetical protein
VSISSLHNWAEQGFPFEANTIVVESDGQITRRSPRPIEFAFRVGDLYFKGAARRNDTGGHLRVTAILAPLPYSVENRQARVDLAGVVAASRGRIPGDCTLAIDTHQMITLDANLDVPNPMSPSQVVAASASLVAGAWPWLSLVADVAQGR